MNKEIELPLYCGSKNNINKCTITPLRPSNVIKDTSSDSLLHRQEYGEMTNLNKSYKPVNKESS